MLSSLYLKMVYIVEITRISAFRGYMTWSTFFFFLLLFFCVSDNFTLSPLGVPPAVRWIVKGLNKSRGGSMSLFQNWADTPKIWVSTDFDPILEQVWGIFIFINQCCIFIPQCGPQPDYDFLCVTQTTKYRQLYCKEKQQMNEYIILIWQKI